MREILFRGKRTDTGEWVYGSYLRRTHPCIECFEFAEDGVPEPHIYEVYAETVGQYTGLADKNGQNIFEEDIVRYVYEPGKGFWNANQLSVIEWKSTGFYMRGIMGTNKYACMDGWLTTIPYSSCNFEVIGNIYDNPELC